MAKKKTAKRRARVVSKKGPRAKSKTVGLKKASLRPASRRRTNPSTVAKKGPKTAVKHAMAALAHTNHTKSRIGITKGLKIKADGVTPTTFRVYGDSIGTANATNKTVQPPTAKHHTFSLVGTADVDANSIDITVTCTHNRPIRGVFGMDDLTVTIIIDDGMGNLDQTECTFNDVEYDP